MTITLHWWLFPLALVAIGVIAYKVDERNVGFMSAPWAGAIVLCACWFGALMFAIGHYLGATP